MNILILTGRFGMGHVSAAKAVEDELNEMKRDLNISTVDLLEYLFPTCNEFIYKAFNRVADKHHEIYSTIYNMSNKVDMDMKLSGNTINRRIEKLLENTRPDIIISTLPLCASTMSSYKEKNDLDALLVTCITDITMHTAWLSKKTDIYLVPTKEVKLNLVLNGVEKDSIRVIGIPVRQEFKNISKDKGEDILIMGGGLGILPNIDWLLETLEKDKINSTLITGKNKLAYKQLKDKYELAEVVGFTDRVCDYMTRSKLLISKAGGITLFESIYTLTPLFVIKPFLPQEVENARFIEEKEIGKVVWDDSNLEEEILKLLDNDLELRRMRKNIEKLKESLIEEDIYNVLEELCEKVAA